MSTLFISWARENGRTRDLAQALDVESHFIYLPGRFGLLGRYIRQARATRKLVRASQPNSIILMLPPAPALFSLSGLLGPNRTLIVDLHTGFFSDPKWRWAYKWCLRFVKRNHGTAIVTNDHLKSLCTRTGVDSLVLHDVIDPVHALTNMGHLLCPVSYANDEPIEAMLEAAKNTPEIEWVFTGNAPSSVKGAAPANVRFPGFVTDDEYDTLLRSSAGVVALTTRPHTMQRAGYEAFNAGVPQLTSDFPELQNYYSDAAIYASPTASAIAKGARALLDSRDQLVLKSLQLRSQRTAEQQAALQQLKTVLNIGSSDSHGSREGEVQ